MSKQKLARLIIVCITAITLVVVITMFPACQSSTPTPPTYGLEFDGVDDYVNVGDSSSLMFIDALTISCWLKTSAHPATNRTAIIAARTTEWGAGWYGDTWMLCMNASGHVWGAVTLERPGDNPIRDSITSAVPVALDAWVYVAYTWQRNSSTGRAIYLNGQADSYGGSRDYSIRALTKPAWIGGHNSSGLGASPTDISFNGIISELRIYNRALTATEIKGLYTGSDVTNGLVGYWRLNEGVGTIAHDSTANNNTGTLEGNPVWFTGAG